MAKGIRSKKRRANNLLKKKRLEKWEHQKLLAVVDQLKSSLEATSIDPAELLSLEQQAQRVVATNQKVFVHLEDDAPAAPSVASPAAGSSSTSTEQRGLQKKPVTLKTRKAVRLEMKAAAHTPTPRKKQPSI
jgi:hypothetical protein